MWGRIGLLLAAGALTAGQAAWAVARAVLATVWLWTRRALGIVLALVVLFEEWGWRPLADLLGQLRRLQLIARLENRIQVLPPYAALFVFAVPSVCLFPLKLVGLYLIAHGQKLAAIALIGFAKVAGTAIVARLFLLTKPQLMRIGWFARLYNLVMPWKEAVFAQIRASWAWRYGRMLKSKVKQILRRSWKSWRPGLVRQLAAMRVALHLWVRRWRGQ